MRISDWSSDVCSSDLPIEWIAKQHARNELLKRETTLAPPSGHTGFDLVFRTPPSGIKRLTICPHMLTAQKGVESRKRGHGVALSTCINAACDRQLHSDLVCPLMRLRHLAFPRLVAVCDVSLGLFEYNCFFPSTT